MPMDRSKYPENWEEISQKVKWWSGWKCQQCHVEHDSYIFRDQHSPEVWRYATDAEMMDDSENAPKPIHVILTVHHVGVDKPDGTPGDPNDKMDCRPENLMALCQRCHLIADQLSHMKAASVTRGAKKDRQQLEAGQGELFS